MKNLTLSFLFLIIFSNLYSQSNSRKLKEYKSTVLYSRKDIALVTGFQLQKNQFMEIGIAIKNNEFMRRYPSTEIYVLSNELKLNKEFIWGLKAGCWIGGGHNIFNLGFNLINYTNFSSNTVRFRPEIGFGYGSFRIVYGYNCAITNKTFEGVNRHNFGLNFILNVKKIKEVKVNR